MRKALLIFFLISFYCVQSQSVKITSDDAVDFSRFTTFRVDQGEIVTIAEQKMNEKQIYQIMKDAITRQLSEKGYKAADDASADLVITYIGQMLTRVDSEQLGPLGQRPATNPSDVNNDRNWSRESTQGNIVIEVTDASSKKTIWRADAIIENVSPEDERVLNSIAFRSFKKFPVRKK